jgi:hypothetical protein
MRKEIMVQLWQSLSEKMRSAREKWELLRLKQHVLDQIEKTEASFDPFGHLFVSSIFPEDFYLALREHLQKCKGSSRVQDRLQDNSEYINKRFNLVHNEERVPCQLRALFSDPAVKIALAKKFYTDPERVTERLSIHKEFEYMFTAAGRMQNIHTDIPPKFLSLVFYIPEQALSEEQELLNATVLYDKNLKPVHKARYRANSVCVFAPHFYSYHSFATTVERDSMVLFYVDQALLGQWRAETAGETAPFEEIRNQIAEKLRQYPLIEYGANEEKIESEKAQCRINAPNGRVMV